MPDRKPLNVELSAADRLHLNSIVTYWDCSLAEAVRRMIRATAEHVVRQNFMCPDSRACSCPHLVPKRPEPSAAPPPGQPAAGSAG